MKTGRLWSISGPDTRLMTMTNPGSPNVAPGGPGIEPRWTRGAKVAVGTAYSTTSRVWYTLDHGCITEVYYPTIDSPQIRDLQFLVTAAETFLHDERSNFAAEIACLRPTCALKSAFEIKKPVTQSTKQSSATHIKTVCWSTFVWKRRPSCWSN